MFSYYIYIIRVSLIKEFNDDAITNTKEEPIIILIV
jgi:hypothetical protein